MLRRFNLTHNVRTLAALCAAAVAVMPVAPEAVRFVQLNVTHGPPMSAAEKIQGIASCARSVPCVAFLLPHVTPDVPPSAASISSPGQETTVVHPDTGVPYSLELPASNRIRAPSA